MSVSSEDAKKDATEPAPAQGSLGRQATLGMAWLTVQSIGSRAVQLVAQMVLAKILFPDDFGKIALATTLTTLVFAVADFGIDSFLIQRQRTIGLWLTPSFWLATTIGVALMLFCFAAAPVMAAIYKTPELIGLIVVIATALPLGALAVTPMAMLRARMEFRTMAGFSFAEVFGTQIVSVGLALAGFGPYSFAWAFPVIALLKSAAFWAYVKPPIRLRRWDVRRWRQLLASGSNVAGSRLLTSLVSQIDIIVIGLVAAATNVGLYYLAFRLSVQPLRLLAGSISGVMHPTLSSLRTDPQRQTEAALLAARVLAFMIMPVCAMQAAAAPIFLNLLFGDKWADAAILIQLLSIGLAFDAVSWISGALLYSQGRFGTAFILSCIFSGMFVAFVVLGGLIDLGAAPELRVAAAVAGFYTLVQPFYSVYIFGRRGIGAGVVLGLHLKPACFAALAAFAGYACATALPQDQNIARLAVLGLVSTALYLLFVRLIERRVYDEIVARGRSLLHRRTQAT